MHRRLLLVLALLWAHAGCAAPRFNVVLGARDEIDSEEVLPSVGFAADFGGAGWPVRPELGIAIGFDPLYGGNETEIAAGAVRYWKMSGGAPFVGAGIVSVSSDWGANAGASTGFYLHGGYSWLTEKRLRLGVDARCLTADYFEVYGLPFAVGYFQVAFLLGW